MPTDTKAWREFSYPPCIIAGFVVNSEPLSGASPSVRLCVEPELSRCVHSQKMSVYNFGRQGT
jgi:hypothetical protein